MDTDDTPIWRRPAFWRDRAAEWRGPEDFNTSGGLCLQIINQCYDDGTKSWTQRELEVDARLAFLDRYKPDKRENGTYWFPLSDRTSRAALCDRIADDLEKQQTNEITT